LDHGDKKSQDVIIYKNTFHNSHGDVNGLVGIILDITERKQAEDRLKKSEKELRHANATKDKFFSIIAHDLKNPIAAIMGFVEILITEFEFLTDGEKFEIIENLGKASENTFKLLQNLLDWAKSQTGKLNIKSEEFDISELANENIKVLGSIAHAKNIKVISKVPYNTLIKADKNMVNTVIRNLVSNAIKFTKPGGKVSISSTRSNGFIETEVKDNGVGIPTSNIKKLFKLDDQVKTKGTANETGSGLGLLLCREFIEKNSGELMVQSEVEVGSTFTFKLPAA
jgi:signal transduction histidine kinase